MRVNSARVSHILSFLLVLSFLLFFQPLFNLFFPRRFSFFLCICILSNFSREIANVGFLLAFLGQR